MNCALHNSFNRVSLMVCMVLQLALPLICSANNNTIPKSVKQCNCECDEVAALKHEPITSENVIKWAKAAVTASFSYGFGNYETALEHASAYFTPRGWLEYKRALYKSGNLDAVTTNKLVVSGQLTSSPRIVKTTKNSSGQDVWEINVPVQVTYQNALHVVKQNLLITLQIDTAPNATVMKDLGISQFIAEPETA